MRKCKIVHINDGRPSEKTNGDFMYVEEYPRMAAIIDEYLKKGYEVKSMVPDYTPGTQGEGNYSFYKGGMTFYLEKEV